MFTLDQTAVIVPVPAAESLVAGWRRRFDVAAAYGVPAHVTVVFPFVPWPELTADDRRDLRALVASRASFEMTLARTGTFDGTPGVLYLAPADPAPFAGLTTDLVHRWPQAPPYGGAFGPTPVPHLTVTETAGSDDRRAAELDVVAHLPLRTRLTGARLLRFDGARWITAEPLPFQG